MKIAIDIDNTITASKSSVEFFRTLTTLLISAHQIIIISNRDEADRETTEEELDVLGIRYNKLILTADKAEYILKHGIEFLFEDTDEYLLELPDSVTVFKIRESGNFCFLDHKWIGSPKTTKMI
jgi:uncharacterized HAD superfamily protein